MKYSEKFYRDFSDTTRWKTFRVKVETTDLYIRAWKDLSDLTREIVTGLRKDLREHISVQPEFLSSFQPVEILCNTAQIVSKMYRASDAAGVGPIASVAGAIAQELGLELLNCSEEIIIENGGDIWLKVTSPVYLSIYAGTSPFSGKLALRISNCDEPMGICTSSGRFGHSFSFGDADAVTIISPDTVLADAVATETCNLVKNEDDIEKALQYAMNIENISGVMIIYRDKLSIKGDVELADPCTV